MIRTIRAKDIYRKLALGLAFVFLFQAFYPTAAWALTGGPSQPEVQSFEPIGTTDMVNMFTGDFTYNIPLLDVGGYPVNLSYHAGPSMDQEASWVGLGWNINPGAITRNMRGIPDDFDGTDEIKKTMSIEPNVTFGFKGGVGVELLGIDAGSLGLSLGVGINYNNYVGVGFETSVGISASLGDKNSGSLTGGLGLTSSGNDGLDITPRLGLSVSAKEDKGGSTSTGVSIGLPYNSRSGLKGLTIGVSHSKSYGRTNAKGEKVQSTSKSVGNSSTISFASQTYVPTIDQEMTNFSVDMKVNIGATIWSLEGSVDVQGYFSAQQLTYPHQDIPAYGYLNTYKAEDKPYAMLDYNREKDMPYSKRVPNLPLTSMTYDILSVTGQGVGGMYRPYMGYAGHVFDRKAQNLSGSAAVGVEVDAGNTAHTGVSVNLNIVSTTTQKWSQGNGALNSFSLDEENLPIDFEPVYFKQVGDITVGADEAFREEYENDDPIAVELATPSGLSVNANSRYVKEVAGTAFDGSPDDLPVFPETGAESGSRIKRNQLISYLTIKEAADFGIQPTLYADMINEGKDHHIGEITVLRPDGARYIYGLPAYNNQQSEVTFNASGLGGDIVNGLVTYTPNIDNAAANSNGRDHLFSKTDIPDYAHSYLLTAIVSPDYVDVNGDGPSLNDLGTYTKFEYDKISSNYGWRVPCELNNASFDEGQHSKSEDDKGHYLYGQKEVWYLSKIRTRTHVAEFNLSNRLDSRGVINENGGVPTNPNTGTLKKLDNIKLYSAPNYTGTSPDAGAEVVKMVHFQYGDEGNCYALVPNASNNNNEGSCDGKLTLTGVYFTYGNSQKGKFSPYKFKYSGFNPSYHIKGYDRWGNYKPVPGISDPTEYPVGLNQLPPAVFPYVTQDTWTAEAPPEVSSNCEEGIVTGGLFTTPVLNGSSSYADLYAQAWNLTEIKLPSGGVIKVDYEADDYAYVQDKEAGRMFKIDGFFSNESLGGLPNLLFDGAGRNFMKVSFDHEVANRGEFERAYLTDAIKKHLYFRCRVDLGSDSHPLSPGSAWEYISGYAEIEDFDWISDNSAWIKLKGVGMDESDGSENPISKAAWNYGRMNNPRLMNGQAEFADITNPLSVIQQLASSDMIANIISAISGPNLKAKQENRGKHIDLDASWIRLKEPTGFKQGGGHRVSKITLSDEWSGMTDDGEDSFAYGQEYGYRLEDGSKSSGVASYEPFLGGDENPFKLPIAIREELVLIPDLESYQEEPFGESFFPAPLVGYSRVEVRNLQHEDVNRNATGHMVHEFYTAKDYPTKTSRTPIDPIPTGINPIIALFSMMSSDNMTVSQGFVVELNDMHGKPKAVSNYSQGGRSDAENPAPPRLISRTSYKYRDNGGNELKNDDVRVVMKHAIEGSHVKSAEVGVDMDIIADFRQQKTEAISSGLAVNVATFQIGPIPAVCPTFWPSFNRSENQFKSATVTKVIQRYGLLESTTVKHEESEITTRNLAYDEESGNVILTQTTNEFNDDIFEFTYPAHWGYDRMGPAYENIGIQFSTTTGNDGKFPPADVPFLVPGDEVSVNTEPPSKGWVFQNDYDKFLIDQDGQLMTNLDNEFKVIRSGRRNMQSLNIGTVVSTTDPLVTGQLLFENPGDPEDPEDLDETGSKVLQAAAIEYDEKWQTQCVGCAVYEGMNCFLEVPEIVPCPNGGFPIAVEYVAGASYSWYFNGNPTPITGAVNHYYPYADLCSGNYRVEVTIDGCSGFSPVLEITCNVGDCSPSEIETPPILVHNVPTVLSDSDPLIDEKANPYVKGILGNWRPKRSHTYMAERRQDVATHEGNTVIRNEGTLVAYDASDEAIEFQTFWRPPTGTTGDWSTEDEYWTWVTEITKYNQLGAEVENRNALGIPSAALYAHWNTLPVAVASNSEYNEIAYESFEEFQDPDAECGTRHFIPESIYGYEEGVAHTGTRSLKVPVGDTERIPVILGQSDCGDYLVTPRDQPSGYDLHACDCIGRFAPHADAGEYDGKYILSVWTKRNFAVDALGEDGYISMSGEPGRATITSEKRSPIIEGWQKIDVHFTINDVVDPDAPDLLFNLHGGAGIAYYDDLRIFPADANMKTYAFHPRSLRLMAELNENNYATFYEYDEEGKLIRIKKETEKGIVTLQESRSTNRIAQ